jgi:hypothetical protein
LWFGGCGGGLGGRVLEVGGWLSEIDILSVIVKRRWLGSEEEAQQPCSVQVISRREKSELVCQTFVRNSD